MIDTHSHIDGPEFAADINEVILRAKTAGVEKIFVPAIDLKGLPNLIDTCQHYPKYSLSPAISLPSFAHILLFDTPIDRVSPISS